MNRTDTLRCTKCGSVRTVEVEAPGPNIDLPVGHCPECPT